MVIEHAERFGLAQLHQLRGRVGRGAKASKCVLIAAPTTDDAEARLRAIVESTDGFALAEKDLEIRGPGQLAGAAQAGASALRLADLERDQDLLAMARRDASAWLDASPRLDKPDDILLKRRLLKTHGTTLSLAGMA
jgi:ATP-dependent DNA helicase RecG